MALRNTTQTAEKEKLTIWLSHTWSTKLLLQVHQQVGAFLVRHAGESVVGVDASEIGHEARVRMLRAKVLLDLNKKPHNSISDMRTL